MALALRILIKSNKISSRKLCQCTHSWTGEHLYCSAFCQPRACCYLIVLSLPIWALETLKFFTVNYLIASGVGHFTYIYWSFVLLLGMVWWCHLLTSVLGWWAVPRVCHHQLPAGHHSWLKCCHKVIQNSSHSKTKHISKSSSDHLSFR